MMILRRIATEAGFRIIGVYARPMTRASTRSLLVHAILGAGLALPDAAVASLAQSAKPLTQASGPDQSQPSSAGASKPVPPATAPEQDPSTVPSSSGDAINPGQKTEAVQSQDKPRSLDDLLGIPGQEGAGSGNAEEAAAREQRRRLERSLDEVGMDDLVQRALEGMKAASKLLDEEKDPGLGTQRVQEDVVTILDRLLEEAQKQQQQSSSSSSRSKSSSKSSSDRQQQSDPSEQNGQQRSGSQQANRSKRDQQGNEATASGENEQGADRERDDSPSAPIGELAETRIEWGQLPERVRELVLQGRRDRVSTLYERMTREYYRRLAEEASR